MRKPLLAAGALLVAVSPSGADTKSVPFLADVTATCTILVVREGFMVANADHTILGTHLPGGIPGVADIVTNRLGFSFFLTRPSGWRQVPPPPAVNTNADSWSSRVTMSGATTGIVNPGFDGFGPTPIGNGTTQIAIDLIASKTGGTFPEGMYAVDVPVTCE